ncbi:hypothetical protein GCM10023193_82020 [Planotetraspora kaengkrachanensis]|uniref:Uncharacterized protein n=1 Tax=Planotetraspora kaengkrachanensis TaxID=575193 RepID=A0A8J3VD04_9ACTN|nr:hypothetical protein Pka01_81010 [Planotetraspora kaengkrachanensis]
MGADPLEALAEAWAAFDGSLRSGVGFDISAYEATKASLTACAAAWRELDCIPRLGVNIVVDVFPATEANAAMYDGEVADRIMAAAYELHDLVGEAVGL